MNSAGIRSSAASVDLGKNLMIPQYALNKILESIRKGNCCLVVGPRYRGKSKLVRKAAEELARTGFYRVAYLSMSDITELDSGEFYQALYRSIQSQIKGNIPINGEKISSASGFRNIMLEQMAGMEDNLLLQIDDLEIAPPNLISLLLGSIRSVFTTVANQPGARFQAIVSGTVNLHQLALRGVSRFESISDLVLVDDMTLEEARLFAAELFSNAAIHVPAAALDAFLQQTSSDPVLIRLLASQCIEHRTLQEATLYADMLPEAVDRALKLKPNYEVAEALSRIEGDPELLSCYLEIAQKGETPVNELPLRTADSPNALDLCGVFRRKNGSYSIKSPLWRALLNTHFTSAHCGRLYAIAGYWSKAIEYYQKAIHKDKIDKKSELLGATINGMQASEDDYRAVALLAQGLHAGYPEFEIGLYLRTESVLRLEYSFPGRDAATVSLRQEIPLNDHTSPEVEALLGPDYSKVSYQKKTQIFIPLRVNSGAHAIGVVSYGGELSQLNPYDQHEEILQLISFLRQAARAIDERRKYSSALEDAKSHAQTLESLDHILTSVLKHLELEDEMLFRLLLAGLTANEGLRFNRAALFLFNEQKGELAGAMGVGNLSWKEADFDWKNFPYQNIDELLDALMSPEYQYTPLHEVVKSIQFPVSTEDIFGKVFEKRTTYLSRQIMSVQEKLPTSFLEAIEPAGEFAVAPLTAGTRHLGLVYVDNKFTHHPIDAFHLASLTGFLTQAVLVMAIARSLRAEKQQSKILSRLLEIEKTVNNKITRSMQAVLDEIARSAWELMGADSTVAFSLKRTTQQQDNYFEIDQAAREHTRAALVGKPNSREGMLKWVLADGHVHLKDVHLAPPFEDGYHPQQSKFLKKEGVRSLVGLRLGTKDTPQGVLFVNWYSPHTLSDIDLSILQVFGAFASAAIPSARRHERISQELGQRTRELQALSNLIEASLDSRPERELENLIQETLSSLRRLTRAPVIRLYLLEPGDHLREYWLARKGILASRVMARVRNDTVNRALDNSEVIRQEYPPLLPGIQLDGKITPALRTKLAIPLLKGRNRLGAFYFEMRQTDRVQANDEDLEFIHHLADRLAITYHQAEVYNSLRRLLDISFMLRPDFDIKQVIRELVEGAVQAMPSISTVSAFFMNPQTGQFELGHVVGVRSKEKVLRYKLTPGSLIDRLNDRGEIFADLTEKDEVLNSPFAVREGIKSTAAMPLEVGTDRVGYIFFNFRRQYFFDETRKGWLRLFAQIAALAIQRTKLQTDLARRQSRLEAVAQITPLIARVNPDITEVYRTVLREITKAIPRADNACIVERQSSLTARQPGYYRLVLIPPSQEFYHATRISTINGYEMGKARMRGIASRVIEDQKAEIVADVRQDRAYFRAVHTTRSEMCIPIPGTQQAIVLESDELDAFSPEDQELMEMLAQHIAAALNNEKQFRAQQEHQTRERVAQMATGIIHDVSHLISNIPDLVEELRNELASSKNKAAIEECLHDLQASAASTHRISSKLREFAIGIEFKAKYDDLGQLVRKVIQDLEPARPPHVEIHHVQPPYLPTMKFDSLWMEQLFSNLLYNAFEAIPSHRKGKVLVTVWFDENNIYVSVRDNGRGMDRDIREQIFEPGFTTKKGQARLHGIGLYFCRQIAVAHEGEIHVQSTPGSGTTLTVTFPMGNSVREDYARDKSF